MKGRDVTYSTAYGDGFWVSDNTYDVYEVPAKSNTNNKYSFIGHFLTLIHNKSWDYWVFATMTDRIDFVKTQNTKSVSEIVHYTLYGQYSILVGNGIQDTVVTKEKKGRQLTQGHVYHNNRVFDSTGIRKYAYCKKSRSMILGEILGYQKNDISSKKTVKIYNKNNRRNRVFN